MSRTEFFGPSTATLPRLSGPLGGWKAKLATAPDTAKVVFLGDSTSDPVTTAHTMYRRLLGMHTQQGEALHDLGSADKFTDGVANGTTTYTSATANFTAADVGRLVHGTGITNATVIASRTNSTTVVLSNTVPSGTGLTFWVGRKVIGGGNNGMLLSYWLANPSFGSGSGRYNRDALVADAPDLTVASWLLNDIRQGALGLTVNAIVTAGTALLQQFVDIHRTLLPNTDLLLRMPNPMLTANVSSNNFVTDGSTTNPAGLAQIYTTAMRRIYLSFVGKYKNVDVIDIQGEVFGSRSAASHPLMTDQLHPNGSTSSDVNLLNPVGGGYVAIADAIARRIGFERNAFAPGQTQRVRHEFIVYSAPSAGQVRLISRDYNVPAAQAPVFRTDSLYVNGLDSPIALSAATLDRVTGANFMVITGLGATDFAPYIGQTAVVTGSHPAATTGDRQQLTVDLPSIAAGATGTLNVTVTGVALGSVGHGAAVIAAPGSGFVGSGLLLTGCYVQGTDTVRLVVLNPTAGAIDQAGESWTFWVVR